MPSQTLGSGKVYVTLASNGNINALRNGAVESVPIHFAPLGPRQGRVRKLTTLRQLEEQRFDVRIHTGSANGRMLAAIGRERGGRVFIGQDSVLGGVKNTRMFRSWDLVKCGLIKPEKGDALSREGWYRLTPLGRSVLKTVNQGGTHTVKLPRYQQRTLEAVRSKVVHLIQ